MMLMDCQEISESIACVGTIVFERHLNATDGKCNIFATNCRSVLHATQQDGSFFHHQSCMKVLYFRGHLSLTTTFIRSFHT